MPFPTKSACQIWIPPSDGGYRCRACGRAREYHTEGRMTKDQIDALEAIFQSELDAGKGPWEAALALVMHAQKNWKPKRAPTGRPAKKCPMCKGVQR